MRRNTKILTIYVELSSGRSLREFLNRAKKNGIIISNIQFESGSTSIEGATFFIANVKNKNKQKKEEILHVINEMYEVQYMEEL